MDHYSTLGVNKDASLDEIKRAFRRLASQHHPDKGGDTAKFQEIQAAYDVLGDAEKRRQYDNPAPDWAGAGHPGGFSFNFGGGPQFNSDFFSQMFGQGFGQQSRRSHVRVSVWVTLEEVARGTTKMLALNTQDGTNTVEVAIPQNIQDGDAVQYSKVAPGGHDLVVQYRIQPHPRFQRVGNDLHSSQNIPIWDLITGGEIEIEGLLGTRFSMKIPARTQPGTQMRIRTQGMPLRNGPTGDLYVKLVGHVPEKIAPEIIAAIQQHR